MLWPLILPFKITFWSFAGIVIVLTLFSPKLKWGRPTTFILSSVLAALLFIPSCAGVMMIVDSVRFGEFKYATYEEVDDVRIRRYLPPAARKISLEKHSPGHCARYSITELELRDFLDGLWDEAVRFRLGKQDINTEVLLMDSAVDFIQSGFGLSPAVGLPSYPDPTMAAVALLQITESVEFKLGVWDGFGDGGSWGFSGNEVVLTVGELEIEYRLPRCGAPGTIALGAAYSSPGEIPEGSLPAAHGFYIQLEQVVYREPSSTRTVPQGLALFAQYVPSYSDGAPPVPDLPKDAVGGLVYRGLIDGRDEDVAGLGVSWAKLRLGGSNQETVFEAFYKARITSSLSVQPDTQYIATPSGIYRDSLVAGVRFELAL